MTRNQSLLPPLNKSFSHLMVHRLASHPTDPPPMPRNLPSMTINPRLLPTTTDLAMPPHAPGHVLTSPLTRHAVITQPIRQPLPPQEVNKAKFLGLISSAYTATSVGTMNTRVHLRSLANPLLSQSGRSKHAATFVIKLDTLPLTVPQNTAMLSSALRHFKNSLPRQDQDKNLLTQLTPLPPLLPPPPPLQKLKIPRQHLPLIPTLLVLPTCILRTLPLCLPMLGQHCTHLSSEHIDSSSQSLTIAYCLSLPFFIPSFS